MRPFASQVNFLDPQTTETGEPYGPIRFRELVRECYILSKNLNTSYTHILNITPVERNYLLKLLIEEAKHQKDLIEKSKAEAKAKK